MFNRKRFIIVLLIIVLSFQSVFAAGKLKNKKKNIDKKIKDTKTEINIKQKESTSVYNTILKFGNNISILNTSIVNLNTAIIDTDKKIAQKSSELEDAKERLKENDSLFRKRLRSMYMNSDDNYVTVLLSSKSLDDCLSKKNMVQKMAKRDKKLIESIEGEVDNIVKIKTTLENLKTTQVQNKNKLSSQKDEVSKLKIEQEKQFTILKNDIEKAKKSLAKLERDSRNLSAQILKLQSSTKKFVGGKLGWPLPGYTRISSGYGYRTHPILNIRRLHSGIDIPAPTGTNIVAAASGTVIFAGKYGGYGNLILVDHGGKIVTGYAHCSRLLKSKGAKVTKGQAIAKVGSTGFSTGAHLHFEVRKNGNFTNPINWVR